MNIETGTIFDIQRYSLHDGPGIRTLVFMKGCSLRCLWCSNPESQSFEIETGFVKNKCVGCGKCFEACPQSATKQGTFDIDRTLCNVSGDCVEVCSYGAKKTIGEKFTVDQIIEIIEKDRLFYENSSGGITVGGGEPCGQSNFVPALLKKCKEIHIHTCIETCGFAKADDFAKCVENADLILFDLKHMDSKKHLELTGARNEQILSNAKSIYGDKEIIFRVPLIPGMNDDFENIEQTIAFAESIESAKAVEFLPYHTLGAGKYDWVGKKYALNSLHPYSEEDKERITQFVLNRNNKITVHLI